MFIVISPGPVIFVGLVDNRYANTSTIFSKKRIVSVFGISFQVRRIGTCLSCRSKSSSRLQRNSRTRGEVWVEDKTDGRCREGGGQQAALFASTLV